MKDWYKKKENPRNQSMKESSKNISKKIKVIIKNSDSKETAIEIKENDLLSKLIENYCNNIGIEYNDKLYYTLNNNSEKLNNKEKLSNLGIKNNDILIIKKIEEEENNINDNVNNESSGIEEEDFNGIKFYLEYLGEKIELICKGDQKFEDVIKPFYDKQNGDKEFTYIFNNKIIDKNSTIKYLGIKDQNIVIAGKTPKL